MENKFTFNLNAFQKKFISKTLWVWAIISTVLNLTAVSNDTWSFAFFLIVVIITGAPIFGIYFHQKHQWKLAYIVLNDSHLIYFRIVKDGFLTDTSSYEYEARETVVTMPCQCRVKENKVYLVGNMIERIYKDKRHKKVETTYRNVIKIPLYFGERDEFLTALNRYQ